MGHSGDKRECLDFGHCKGRKNGNRGGLSMIGGLFYWGGEVRRVENLLLHTIEFYMSWIFSSSSRRVDKSLASLQGDFASPKSGLVKVAETVDHDGHGQSNGENSEKSCDTPDKFAESRQRCCGA